MAKFAYLFEARGIQRFLFATGKLKDMVAGSELVDFICANNGYLDQVLKALNLTDKVTYPRKAGGAFYLVFNSQEEALRFQSVWRLVTAQLLPSLERVDALCEGETIQKAIRNGIELLAQARNKVEIELPVASPVTERSPRTGLPTVKQSYTAGNTKESIDAATAVMRQFLNQLDKNTPLTTRFLGKHNIDLPNNFEKDEEDKRFPLGQRSLVGLIHADGNGLGEILRILNDACKDATDEQYITLYKCFSDGVTEATKKAAQIATKVLLEKNVEKVLPARPLVLGGDDLSVIVRADLAIPYTQAFLKAFKETSEDKIDELKKEFEKFGLKGAEKLPNYLTACAGIVFMKASQPFYSAYTLAEGLCKRAKTYSRQHKKTEDGNEKVEIIPSSLAFYKINDSVLEDVESMIQQTQIAMNGEVEYRLSMPAYLVEEQYPSLANIKDLIELSDFIKNSKLNDKVLRELGTLLFLDDKQAKQIYRRWNQYNKKQSSNSEQQPKEAIEEFQQRLEKIVAGKLIEDLPFTRVDDSSKIYQSVLGDLLVLFTIREEVLEGGSQNQEISNGQSE